MVGARRLLLTGTALTVLLALVALASRAHRPGGGSGGGATTDTPRLVFEYVASAFLVLFPLGAIVVVWLVALGRRRQLLAGGSVRRQAAALLVAAVLVVPAALAVRHFVHHISPPKKPQPNAFLGKQSAKKPRAKPARQNEHAQPQFKWVSAVVVGSLLVAVVAGVGAALLWKRRRGADWEREAELMAALDEVLADTLDDLRAERDPRRAVISAYARMERTFAAHDAVRDPAETPREYVERALDRLGISMFGVRRLTSLYERAKFSRHEIDVSMKEDAIDALAGLRAELEPESTAA